LRRLKQANNFLALTDLEFIKDCSNAFRKDNF